MSEVMRGRLGTIRGLLCVLFSLNLNEQILYGLNCTIAVSSLRICGRHIIPVESLV